MHITARIIDLKDMALRRALFGVISMTVWCVSCGAGITSVFNMGSATCSESGSNTRLDIAFQTSTGRSKVHCAELCLSSDTCRSFSVHPLERVCQLHSFRASANQCSSLQIADGFRYFEEIPGESTTPATGPPVITTQLTTLPQDLTSSRNTQPTTGVTPEVTIPSVDVGGIDIIITIPGQESLPIYRVSDSSSSWEQALKICENDGGTLANVKTSAAYSAIMTSVSNSDVGTFLWVGGSFNGGSWKWTDGSQVSDGYENWSPAASFSDVSHLCMGLLADSALDNYGTFETGDCDVASRFVCEIPQAA